MARITPDRPRPLSATALLSAMLPESFGQRHWCRGVMDGNPPSQFWISRHHGQFVKEEGGARYIPLTDAWVATTARGLGERLFISPIPSVGYQGTVAPAMDPQAILTKFPIATGPLPGRRNFERRAPGDADAAYRSALATMPTCLVDEGDAIVAIHILSEPVSVEWIAIAAKALWLGTGAAPWEQTQYRDPRVTDPLGNLVSAIRESMLVCLPAQRHPRLVPAFDIRAERVGGIVDWEGMKEKYRLHALADKLAERKAEGRRMLARAMGHA